VAHVSGPVSTLPGAHVRLPDDAVCDDHDDRRAVARIQGETDSFGAEYFDVCAECLERYRTEKAAMDGGAFIGRCDRCGTGDTPLFAMRDPDEGMAGPVYYRCRGCRREINDALAAELDELREHDEPWYPDDGDDDDYVEDRQVWTYAIKFVATGLRVRSRDNRCELRFTALRDAEAFHRRHRGKLRGRRIRIEWLS